MIFMKEERLPQLELDLYLKSLEDSLAEHGRLHPQKTLRLADGGIGRPQPRGF